MINSSAVLVFIKQTIIMKKISIAILILISLFSCSEENESYLPSSTGGPGHLLVIMANNKWEQSPGKVVKDALTVDYELLPQSEPLFDITHLPNKSYSSIMKRTRNILFTQISVNIKKPEVLIAYDKYARPQIVVVVRAKNNKEFVETFNKFKPKIVSSLIEAERNRLIKGYSGKLLSKNINKQLKENHNIILSIPLGFKFDVDSPNFMWISRETPYSSQGILIWDYPYTDTSQFHVENLLNKRDEITKKYVQGPVDSTFMVADRIIPPNFKEFKFKNKYTAEMRGLWKLGGAQKGVFQGGPYISFSQVDKKRNRIITVDGYIYGGRKKKRNLLRQLEAILYTLDINE